MAKFDANEAIKRFSKVEHEMGALLKDAYENKQDGNIEQAIELFNKAIITYNDVMIHINQVYQSGHNSSLDERKIKLRAQYDDAKYQWQELKFEHYQTLKATEIAEKTDAVRKNVDAFQDGLDTSHLQVSSKDASILAEMNNKVLQMADKFINESKNPLKDYPAFVNNMSDMIEDIKPKFSPSFLEKIADSILTLLNGLYSVINTVAKTFGASSNLINPHRLFSDNYRSVHDKINEHIQEFKDNSEVDSADLEIKTTYQV